MAIVYCNGIFIFYFLTILRLYYFLVTAVNVCCYDVLYHLTLSISITQWEPSRVPYTLFRSRI